MLPFLRDTDHAGSIPTEPASPHEMLSSQEAGYSVFKVIEEEKMFLPSITLN